MKFKILGFEKSLSFDHDSTGILSIENRELYFKVISILHEKQRIDNSHPDIFFKDSGNQQIRMANNVKIIMDPFQLDLSKSSFKTKLYRHIEHAMKDLYSDDLLFEFETLVDSLMKALMIFDINLDYDTNLDIKKLLRSINLRPEPITGIDLGLLWNYLDYVSELKMYEICVFINFYSWMPPKIYNSLHAYVIMKNIPSMFIENQKIDNPYGQSLLIDSELCESMKRKA